MPQNTNVVRFEGSPASEHFALRRQELQRLKDENAALLKTLIDVENGLGLGDGEGSGEKMVPWKTWDNVLVEKAELNEKVNQNEKRLLRLQQVRSHLVLYQ